MKKNKKKYFWDLLNKTHNPLYVISPPFRGFKKYKMLFLSSIELTEQRGLCSFAGVFSLSHHVIVNTIIKYYKKKIEK